MEQSGAGEGNAELRLELARLQRGSDEAVYLVRLCATEMTLCGSSPACVAQCLGVSERSVRRWASVFHSAGLAGLKALGVQGRPETLNGTQLATLRATVRRPPREVGLVELEWTGPLLGRHILNTLGVAMSRRQCQRLLRGLRGEPEESASPGG